MLIIEISKNYVKNDFNFFKPEITWPAEPPRVTAMELPPRGPFQQLYPCDLGLCTEFGPGDPGHRGGRWWVDDNGNGEMDMEDVYFLCPLLGPGREEP